MELQYDVQMESAKSQLQLFENQRHAWMQTLAECHAQREAALVQCDQVLASRSWKLTAPLRQIGGLFAKSPGKT
jgi:hypothetical protein